MTWWHLQAMEFSNHNHNWYSFIYSDVWNKLDPFVGKLKFLFTTLLLIVNLVNSHKLYIKLIIILYWFQIFQPNSCKIKFLTII